MNNPITPEVQEKLNSLETLLFEFDNPNTNCSRRQDLEKIFEEFSNDPLVWNHIRDFVKFSSNFYVLHFSLMVTENTLKLHGVCTESELWSEIKFLLQNQVLNMESAPSYLIHRILKINAHIARIDWPHFYPDYFPNIFKLLQSGSSEYHVILGAKCLQITSEEFISPREDVSFARKTELKNFLTSRVLPDIFTLLLRALEVWKSNLKIISAVLEALEQYFSWVPLSEVYSVALIDSICQFTPKLEVGIQALTALNEILYKALVPVSFLPVLSRVISHSFTLIQNVAVLPLKNIPVEYLTKVTENAKLVVTHHWHRIESALSSSLDVSPLDFLSSFLRYTFESRVARENMYDCLGVWITLSDQLANHTEQQLVQYKPTISSLLSKLLEEIQASSCLDDDEQNEDNKTEKQECLDHCNEVIVKTMQLFPSETLNLVLSYWVPPSLVYAEFLSRHNTSQPNQITPDALSAMCNYTQVLTRIHQCTETRRSDLVQTLSRMAVDFTRSQIYRKPEYGRVSMLLVQLQAEVLASLKCWVSTSTSVDTISSLYPATIPLILDKEAPLKLAHAALHLLASVILAANSCELSCLESLIIPNSLIHLPLESRVVLESALIKSTLTKPLASPSNDDRLFVLQSVVNILVRNSTVECHHLSLLLPHCQLTTKQSKQTLYSVLEPWLKQVIVEYPGHFDKHSYRLCEDMVAFVLESFRILQDQMPLQFIQNSVQCFIECFQSVMTPEFHSILDKLFLLLQVIIEQPSVQFKLFVPSSLDLCTRIIHLPDETQVPKSNAYNLLAVILSEKWQFFFRCSQVDPDAESHFCSIMSCLGHSCSSSDISLVGQTVQALEAIQSRWRLFEKDIFKSRFLRSFLSTFLQLLIENQHSLLNEDLTQALYHLAQVDMRGFYAEFMPSFLLELPGLTDSQRHTLHSQLQTHADFSTFTQNVAQLCNDVRCFRKFTKNASIASN